MQEQQQVGCTSSFDEALRHVQIEALCANSAAVSLWDGCVALTRFSLAVCETYLATGFDTASN